MHLPTLDSPVREMFEVQDLADRNWCSLADARNSARRTFFAPGNGAVRRVMFLVLRADDRVQLISFGPYGGWRIEWNFGFAYEIPMGATIVG